MLKYELGKEFDSTKVTKTKCKVCIKYNKQDKQKLINFFVNWKR